MSFLWSRFLAAPKNPDGFMSPPAFFYRLPELETEDLILRKPRMRDAKDIFRYASDPEVARYVLWEPHRSVSETASFVRDLRVRIRAGYPSSWVVTLRETGLVTKFSREYWNHGYATQALRAVIDCLFSSLPLNRLEAQHDVRNPASGRVMQKCGLTQEGILRGRIMNKGEYIDTALYSVLRSDWEKGSAVGTHPALEDVFPGH